MANVIINDTHLTNIANAIREKNGTASTYLPKEMAAAITSLPTGGGGDVIPEEAFQNNVIGNNYRFYNGNNAWLIKNYPDRFVNRFDVASFMFQNFLGDSTITKVPMKLRFSNTHGFECAFASFSRLESIDDIEEPEAYTGDFNANEMFANCRRLRTLPKNMFGSQIADVPLYDWMAQPSQLLDGGMRSAMFIGCYSLRELPNLKTMINAIPWNTLYSQLAADCYTLNEIVNLPVNVGVEMNGDWSSNELDSIVYNCHRLKNFTFEVNADGTPKTAMWAAQTLYLSDGVGWYEFASRFTDYNSGITASKEVNDDSDYNRLKDDPDWFATHKNYSRYNLTSAIATINSLPDCSAYIADNGYTVNTIKFDGDCGKNTDGGAIKNLTEEQIAKAAAKGWTVAL